jgi:hypothetical protein
VDTDSGEFQEGRLQHREEAEKYYRELAAQGMQVRVGMEASGHARWFERLLCELQFELWIGARSGDPKARAQKNPKPTKTPARPLPNNSGTLPASGEK